MAGSGEKTQQRGSRTKILNYIKILEGNPKSFIFAQLAEEYLKLGETDQSIETCLKGLKHNPDFTDGLYVLGVAYFKKGRKDLATEVFVRILKINENHYLAKESLNRLGKKPEVELARENAGFIPELDGEPETEQATPEEKTDVTQDQTTDEEKAEEDKSETQEKTAAFGALIDEEEDEEKTEDTDSAPSPEEPPPSPEASEKTEKESSEEEDEPSEEESEEIELVEEETEESYSEFEIPSGPVQRPEPEKTEKVYTAQKGDGLILEDHDDGKSATQGVWLVPLLVILLIGAGVGGYFLYDWYQAKVALERAEASSLNAHAMLKQDDRNSLLSAIDKLADDTAELPQYPYLSGLMVEAYAKLLLDYDPNNTEWQKGLETSFNKLPTDYSNNSDMVVGVGYRALYNRRIGDLRYVLDNAEKNGIRDPRLICLKAENLLHDGNFDEARKMFLSISDSGIRPKYFAAKIKQMQEDAKEAKSDVEEILKTNPEHVRSRLLLWKTWLDTDRPMVEMEAKMDGWLVKWTNKLPLLQQADLNYIQSLVNDRNGHRKEAIRHMEKSVQINPLPTSLYLLGRMLFDSGDFGAAFKHAEKAAQLDDRKPEHHELLGRIYTKMGRLTSATEEFGKAITDDTNDVDLLLIATEVALQLHTYEKAQVYLERANRIEPSDVDIQKKLIMVVLEQDETQEAQRRIQLLEEQQGETALVNYLKGKLLLTEGDSKNALKEFRKGLKKDPKHFECQLESAKQYLDEFDFEKGFQLLFKLMREHEDNKQLMILLGDYYLAVEDVHNARNMFDKLRKKYPENMLWPLKLAMVDFLLDNRDAAMNVFGKVLTQNSRLGLANTYSGAYELLYGDLKKAETLLDLGIKYDPGNPEAHFWMGELRQKLGDEILARNSYETTLKIQPDFPKAHYRLAMMLIKQNRMDEARFRLKKILPLLEMFPGSKWLRAKVLLRLGEIDFYKSNNPAGMKKFKEAIKVDPNNPEGYYLLAREGNKFVKWENAIKLLERALDIDSNFAPAYFEMGVIYKFKDRNRQARESFLEYLEREPKGELAEQARRELNSL